MNEMNKNHQKKEQAVVVKNLKKTFKIPTEQSSGLKQKLINLAHGKSGYREFSPLKDVNFTINEGDFFGIVGRNGSGKSTLLKTIAGIYEPNEGQVYVKGTLVPFIELGVGFNPELTGRENVFLNGALLGFSSKEMSEMYDDIVDFAELQDFMEEKLKNYSSGMQVRLAFSVAIRAKGDILLLDEVLAVGDADFQKKCFDYFYKLKKDGRTVILVTHDMNAVRQYCNHAILLNEGKVVSDGKADVVAKDYIRLFAKEDGLEDEEEKPEDSEERWGNGKIKFQRVVASEKDGKIVCKAYYKAFEDVEDPVIGFTIYSVMGEKIVENNTVWEKMRTPDIKKGETHVATWSFDNILTNGRNSISVGLSHRNGVDFYDACENVAYVDVDKDQVTTAKTLPGDVIEVSVVD